MSTPIKPPGDPSAKAGAVGPHSSDGVTGKAESADGAFEAMVDGARPAKEPTALEAGAVGALEEDLTAGRMTADAAIEELVQRALGSATGLPEGHRAALEAQLRQALEGDPTLVALREDLQRVASKA